MENIENEMNKPFRTGYNKGLGFGLLLMLVGVLFLGFNFGLLPADLKWVIISWPMLLVVIGIGHFLRRKITLGTVTLLVGIFFLIPKIVHAYPYLFPNFNGDFTQIYWPLLLIAGGIIIILGKVFGPKWGFNDWSHEHYHHHHQRHYHTNNYTKWNGASEGFSKNSVFGSGDHIVLDPEFKGGELNAVFGGITLDLRRTNLPEGETHLDVNAVFGGITIYVPSEWLVETHLDSVFGGFQDNRLVKEPLEPNKKLVITGSCVFGGGELRN